MPKSLTAPAHGTELDIPAAMKIIRERKGLTQGDIYRRTKLERSYISRMETGVIPWPKLRTLYEWCKGAGITLSEFIIIAEDEWRKRYKKDK
jgi:transcriptional regulator with XRE-family HTH domain